ncbi:endoglucanase [Pseudobutyrivibrio sp. YE44]|uniref:glycoside hydrolase family 9 protein n=1 Tax=Pseudobutyrivibrio sp. YE44 TaxID=1520802 RepID=UPI000881DBDB|nr:glycoside hydrolase family 9 protein [Pseudobutyrivibrio sp. YE44]SDB07759.1 endoglucanase [Pseudobutyrivibrio sp. YE44]
MKNVYVNQVGYLSSSTKKAVFNFQPSNFTVVDAKGNVVFQGTATHFGTDEISGEDISFGDFSEVNTSGQYKILAEDAESYSFTIKNDCFEQLMKHACKCFYYLRCGQGLDKDHAGIYYHEPCHTTKATVYGEDVPAVDVSGGWHDAGDYGRYSTAGSVAVAHILYAVRFFPNLLQVKFDIPEEKGDKGLLPDILAEVKVELNFLMKMQRENGSVWHKVTTFNHAPFIMPEADKEELFLFPVSSLATADIAAVFALAYSIYKDYDKNFAELLLDRAKKAYDWLEKNPAPTLFKNAEGSNTGEYPEPEDYSNRFWAACALYEALGDKKYYEDALTQKGKLLHYDGASSEQGFHGNMFTCFGWADVAGLGALSLLLKKEDNELTALVKADFEKEATRLSQNGKKNGFGLCMTKDDFIWGSNMELLKYMMILTVANKLQPKDEYKTLITSGLDYLLGCNTMNISYITGEGTNAYKHPHLRPTDAAGLDPWPGLVSGGPNCGLQDEIAQQIPADTAPMKCYEDHVQAYSLNEITIYWNSPLVFVLAGI